MTFELKRYWIGEGVSPDLHRTHFADMDKKYYVVPDNAWKDLWFSTFKGKFFIYFGWVTSSHVPFRPAFETNQPLTLNERARRDVPARLMFDIDSNKKQLDFNHEEFENFVSVLMKALPHHCPYPARSIIKDQVCPLSLFIMINREKDKDPIPSRSLEVD